MGLLDQTKPKQMGGLLAQLPTDEQMRNMSQYDLYQMRLANRGMPEIQARLAPFEHMATAREQVAENPWRAPIFTIMPAAYQAFKATGLNERDDMTTPASLDQALAGLQGTGQGLMQALGRYFK